MTQPTQQQEPEIRVWLDPVPCQMVIANDSAEIRLDFYQQRLLVAALSNPHTARALLSKAAVMAVGQNLLTVWTSDQEGQANG